MTVADLEARVKTLETEIKAMKAQLGSGTEKTPKKDRVKRKPGKYATYVKAEFGNVKAENPGMSTTDIMKKIGVKWRAQKDSTDTLF